MLTAYRSFHGSAPGAGTLTGENRRWPNEPGIPGVVRFFAPFPYRSPFHTRDPREETERAIAHLEEIVTLRRRRPHRGAADRAGRRQQRRHRLSGKLSRARSRALRPLRNPARLRRGDDRIRPHRRGLRRATLRRDARYVHVRERRHVGIRAARRRRRARIARGALRHPPAPSGHTFSGHPLAMAAGVATLRAYRDETLFERAREIEGWLRTRFDALAAPSQIVGEARGVGAFFGLELVEDRETREPLVPWQGTQLARDVLQRSARPRALCLRALQRRDRRAAADRHTRGARRGVRNSRRRADAIGEG